MPADEEYRSPITPLNRCSRKYGGSGRSTGLWTTGGFLERVADDCNPIEGEAALEDEGDSGPSLEYLVIGAG